MNFYLKGSTNTRIYTTTAMTLSLDTLYKISITFIKFRPKDMFKMRVSVSEADKIGGTAQYVNQDIYLDMV